jgi:hypothetical protein
MISPFIIQYMELTGEGVSVYTEAKGEYTKQLCQFMLPALQQYYLDMLDEAKRKEVNPNKLLLMFQELLEGVPEWNADKVQRETNLLSTNTKCDYLEELLTAVFIAHTKVLSAIRLTTKQKKLQITIPRLEHFLHRTLTECSRQLWSNVYLFSLSVPSIERQKNLRQIETFLHNGIQQAIRSMLPVKNILREYLNEDEEEDEEVEEKLEEKVEELEEKPQVKLEEKPQEKVEEKPEEKPEEKAEEKEEAETIVFTGLDTQKHVEPEKPVPVEPEKPVPVEPEKPVPVEPEKALPAEPEELEFEDIKILDDSPEPMDEFEDLEKTDILQMDFEEL